MNIKNPQYVINSLSNQIAALAQEKALRDALITEQQQEIQELKKQVEKLREEAQKKLDERNNLREKESSQKK